MRPPWCKSRAHCVTDAVFNCNYGLRTPRHSSGDTSMAAMLARLAGAVSRRASASAAWPRAPTVLWWRPLHCTLAPALPSPILQLSLKPRSSVLADWNRGARSANRGSPRAGGGGGGSSSRGALFKRLRESRWRDEVARQIDELRPLRPAGGT